MDDFWSCDCDWSSPRAVHCRASTLQAGGGGLPSLTGSPGWKGSKPTCVWVHVMSPSLGACVSLALLYSSLVVL